MVRFNNTKVDQAVGSVMTLSLNFHRFVSARCLSLFGPTIAPLDVLSASYEPFSLFHHSVFYSSNCDNAVHRLASMRANNFCVLTTAESMVKI